MVGTTGFEPAASSSLRKRDTKLRYVPNVIIITKMRRYGYIF